MNELNPNHPVIDEMREQYHKLLAYLLWRFCQYGRCVITSDDLERFQLERPEGTNLVVEPKGHILTLRIVSDEEGRELARKAGGLPT